MTMSTDLKQDEVREPDHQVDSSGCLSFAYFSWTSKKSKEPAGRYRRTRFVPFKARAGEDQGLGAG